MSGQSVGYIRVSTVTQNTARQLDGVKLDRVFEDLASGKNTERPQLTACRAHLREGDALHVHSMDRLCRSLDDLRRIVKELTNKGVMVKFHKEGLTFNGDDSPMSNLLLSMLGAVAEFERSIILERQKEGIQIAKREGKYKGRKPSLNAERILELKRRACAGEKKTVLAREYEISRETVYAYLGADTKSSLPKLKNLR